MSIHIDLHNIHPVEWVKGWRLDKFVKGLSKKDELKEDCTKAVLLVQGLRQGIENPTVKQITDLIPGNWDEKTVAKTKQILPSVLTALSEGSECLEKPTDMETALCVYQKIKSHSSEVIRGNGWNGVAVAFAVAFSDGKFDLSDVLTMVPAVFKALFGKKD